jgi:hypothetical protein
MPHTAQTQTNFTAGELSPRVFGRTDLARYKNGVGTLENWLPMRQGAVTRRPGFRYVTEVKDSSQATRLIPFEFNTEQTYMLEFGQKTSAALTVAAVDQTLDTITFTGNHIFKMQGTHTFVVSGSTDIDGTYTVTESVLLSGPTQTKVYVEEAVPGATADGTAVVTMGYVRVYRDEGQLESVAGTPTEFDSPYDAGDLFNIKYVQSNDVLFLDHPDYEPHELTRTSGADNLDATWSISKTNPTDGPYLDENTTATTLTFSTGVVGSDTLTASAALFAKTDIGRSVRIRDEDAVDSIGWAEITDFTSTTVVTVDVKTTCTAGAETTWSLGAWSQTTGFPAVVSFFEERLWHAANANEPNTLWSTRLGSFRSYRPTARDAGGTVRYDDGITAQLNSTQLNAIRWMLPDAQGLLLLTDGGVWSLAKVADQLGPSLVDDTSTVPTFGFAARRQNNDTVSALVSPRAAGKIILQLEKGDRRLLQELFTFQDERFVGTDLTVLAEHINVGGVVESALQVRPELRLWLARTDGQLISLTLDIEQQVAAWARHLLGGAVLGEEQASVESIATIREANEDQLWAVVRRTINGQTKRYVEFMEQPFDVNTPQELAFHVDSGLSYGVAGNAEVKTITGASQTDPVVITSAAHGLSNNDTVRIRSVKGMTEINDKSYPIGNVQTDTFTLLGEDGTAHSLYASGGTAIKELETVTGLTHLVGETVNIMVDGARFPPQVVDESGEVALGTDNGASIIHVGLPISSLLITMPLTATTGTDDSRSGITQIAQVLLHLYRSSGGKVGTATDEYNEISYREAADAMGEAVPLFTGIFDTEY